MTIFVNGQYPSEHLGVVRAENAPAALKQAAAGFDGARGMAALLLAATVAALLVFARQVMYPWAERHQWAAWLALWLLPFAALALLAAPTRRAGLALRGAARSWAERRRRAAEDERTWQAALRDPRIMAVIERALDRCGAEHTHS